MFIDPEILSFRSRQHFRCHPVGAASPTDKADAASGPLGARGSSAQALSEAVCEQLEENGNCSVIL